jgi:hypothetical protein
VTFKEAWEEAKIGERLYREELERWYIVKHTDCCHCKEIMWVFGISEQAPITTESIFANDWYIVPKHATRIVRPIKATVKMENGMTYVIPYPPNCIVDIEFEEQPKLQ